MARPGSDALLINADNSGDGLTSLPDALRRGVAFAVEVAEDVLAIDMDDVTLAPTLDQLMAELTEAGHTPCVFESGRQNHRHLFCRVPDREQWLARACNLGFPGNTLRSLSRIRPPLTPHRLGLPVGLVAPASIEDALVALAPPHRRRRRLSPRIYRLLLQGDVDGQYPSRSELVLGIVLGMVNACWGEAAIYGALVSPKNVGGAKIREILNENGERASRQYVAQCYRKARLRHDDSPPTHQGAAEARDEIARFRAFADQQPWPGIAGATCRAVLDAHLGVAFELGTLTYGASDRELAERAGIGRKAVARHNALLTAHGWLTRPTRGGFAKAGSGTPTRVASVWRLPQLHDGGVQPVTPFPSWEGGCVRNGDNYCTEGPQKMEPLPGAVDYFRWRGLGRPGAGQATRRVFELLHQTGTLKAEKIGQDLVMSKRTVWHHLRRLRDDGIAESKNGCWSLVPGVEVALLRAQANRGTLGATAWQKERHRQEREATRERQSSRYMAGLREEVFGMASAAGFAPCASVQGGGETEWGRFIGNAARKTLVLALVELRTRGRPGCAERYLLAPRGVTSGNAVTMLVESFIEIHTDEAPAPASVSAA